jgi:transcriptional antiterminator RfaH
MESNGCWYALRSKPVKEASAAALLARAGLDVYLPQLRVHKQHGKPASVEPFFPGYLFARLDASRGEIRLANYTHGVLHVVGFGNEPTPVPDSIIDALRMRLTPRSELGGVTNYQRGDRLMITSGPLKDVEAIFDAKLSATGRVRVLIQMLSNQCRAEVNVRQLRRVG